MKRSSLTDDLNSPNCNLNLFPFVLSHLCTESKNQETQPELAKPLSDLQYFIFKFLSESQVLARVGEKQALD